MVTVWRCGGVICNGGAGQGSLRYKRTGGQV